MIVKDGMVAVRLVNGNKEATMVFHVVNGRPILVWQAVRSCFGSGVWVSAKPWLGQEKWINNKKY